MTLASDLLPIAFPEPQWVRGQAIEPYKRLARQKPEKVGMICVEVENDKARGSWF